MASRGVFSRNGHVTTTEYHVDHPILDAKVLVGNNGAHGLPDYAHSYDSIYIKENPDGSFREMRLYDPKDGRVTIEIAYHAEPNLTSDRHTKVLHYHQYDNQLKHGEAVKLSASDPLYQKYKKYLEVYGL